MDAIRFNLCRDLSFRHGWPVKKTDDRANDKLNIEIIDTAESLRFIVGNLIGASVCGNGNETIGWKAQFSARLVPRDDFPASFADCICGMTKEQNDRISKEIGGKFE
ncbi:MAG: hypothetical protein Q9P90_07270 [candidate division KSB1 bacterium]|nr:hypothetical protein [candidate division KSB1 bacterium]